jgi:predicted aspartyl protease
MNYPYDDNNYYPPAPVLPITVRVPGDSISQVTIEALVDTGADITCLPRSLIRALHAESASSYDVLGISGVPIGPADSYFLEFEMASKKLLSEVIAVGNEPILGRNLINEFKLNLHGPAQKLVIT